MGPLSATAGSSVWPVSPGWTIYLSENPREKVEEPLFHGVYKQDPQGSDRASCVTPVVGDSWSRENKVEKRRDNSEESSVCLGWGLFLEKRTESGETQL